MAIQVQLFKYEEANHIDNLTTIEIDGEVWFVATDVCALLDLQNVTQSLNALDEDEKLPYTLHRAGQNRNVNLINESGLYALVFRSKKATAKQFRTCYTNYVVC
jgi:prophage antirepressor-like protein